MFEFVRNIRNAVDSARGFSGCHHCGDSWAWKESQIIMYSGVDGNFSQGMFPLCRECFDKLSDEEIVDYCLGLWCSWAKYDHMSERGEMHTPATFPEEQIKKSITEIRKTRQT